MPTYVFSSDDGDSIEHTCSMSAVPKLIRRGSVTYRRDYCAEPKGCWMADHDWSSEEGGKGRYISQIADRPGDPKAWCKNQKEAMDKAKRKGHTVERTR